MNETNLDKFSFEDQIRLGQKLHAEIVHFDKAVKTKK